MFFPDFISHISQKRAVYMGVAILMVLFLHFLMIFHIIPHYWPLNSGVDIFLCLSGLGLCYSYSKKSIWNFYGRRIRRIYPMYFAFTTCSLALAHLQASYQFSTHNLFCQYTTLCCYGAGGEVFEWYMGATILLYFLFPLIRKMQHPLWVLMVYALSAIAYTILPPTFFMQHFVPRWGSFIFGIFLWEILNGDYHKLWLGIVCSCLIIIGIGLHFYSVLFMCSAFLPVILLILYMSFRLMQQMKQGEHLLHCLEWLGRHSLPLYAANALTMHMIYVPLSGISMLDYALWQLLLSGFFITFEKIAMLFISLISMKIHSLHSARERI